jgi:hypothetical protein
MPAEGRAAKPRRARQRSGSSVESLLDEFDRADVFAAVRDHPSERVAEFAGVDAPQFALVVDDPAELKRHLGHEP